MYRSRKEDTSVYLYIKDIVLQPFTEFQEKDILRYSTTMSTDTTYVYEIETYLDPSPFERGRGILYFDDLSNSPLVNCTTYSGTPEQSNRVTVYDDDMNIVDENLYIVDYVDGRIITYPSVSVKYIDYYWNYVSLVDEWSAITAASTPVVVLDLNAVNKVGYQMGGGRKVIRKGNLIVFASSPAERNDLTEVLYDGIYLKSCPLYDFPKGSVLDYDGTFYNRKNNMNKATNLFDRSLVPYSSSLRFESVDSKNISLPLAMTKGKDDVTLSDLNAYRARITFDLVSYDDSY